MVGFRSYVLAIFGAGMLLSSAMPMVALLAV